MPKPLSDINSCWVKRLLCIARRKGLGRLQQMKYGAYWCVVHNSECDHHNLFLAHSIFLLFLTLVQPHHHHHPPTTTTTFLSPPSSQVFHPYLWLFQPLFFIVTLYFASLLFLLQASFYSCSLPLLCPPSPSLFTHLPLTLYVTLLSLTLSTFLLPRSRSEEANKAFSAAVQMHDVLVKAWAMWGDYLENIFVKDRQLHLGVSAITCYLHACRHQNESKSRKYLAKVMRWRNGKGLGVAFYVCDCDFENVLLSNADITS